jgi:decaprenylphospho-beta-D-erythro-pentofuranosid-2-ulose 2-reductase
VKEPVLILGATSAIARSAAAAFAEKRYSLYLAGRDGEELERLASDFRLRYRIEVGWGLFDAEDYESHAGFVERIRGEVGGFRGVLLAFGYLAERGLAESDSKERVAVLARNLIGATSILEPLAACLEQQRSGFVIGISSVAGDRGRQSNYIYGAAKGGFTIYLQGLRNRLSHAGVRVVTIKAGFVDTAMTYGMPGLFLVASPEYVGGRIVRALERGSNVAYIPWFWRYIMLVIKLIPESLFKRLKL